MQYQYDFCLNFQTVFVCCCCCCCYFKHLKKASGIFMILNSIWLLHWIFVPINVDLFYELRGKMQQRARCNRERFNRKKKKSISSYNRLSLKT